jgi:hypothetical protein
MARGVPVIAELQEENDDAQLEVVKMLAKWRSQICPAVMGRDGWSLMP